MFHALATIFAYVPLWITEFNSVHQADPSYLSFIIILFPIYVLVTYVVSLIQIFRIKFCTNFSYFTCICSAHPWFDHAHILWRVYRLWSSSLFNSLYPPVTSFLSGANILLALKLSKHAWEMKFYTHTKQQLKFIVTGMFILILVLRGRSLISYQNSA